MDCLSLIRRPIEAELAEYKSIFDASLTHSQALLGHVLGHIRQRNGKMMRPILMLLIAKNYGGVKKATIHSAVTIELLHTASLVHDDVVDESDERRGQSSINSLYDNKVAVLVGDYLLSTSLLHSSYVGDLRIVDIVAHLGQTLAEGEIIQLDGIHTEGFSEDTYYSIIRRKTAALFAACAQIGALSAGASADHVERARKFGELIGICFQIRDDIFDYYDSKEIGKPTGNDMVEGKLTLPVLYALNSTHDAAMLELAAKVRACTISPDEIASLVDFTKRSGGMEYAEKVMANYHKEACQYVASVTDDAVRESLLRYVDFVVNRNM
jgi:octaprenyl-diphosphate synthase